MTQTAIIFDTETSGFTNPEVIELAFTVPLLFAKLKPKPAPKVFLDRFRPSKLMELGALATHGIIEEDLVACPLWPGSWNPPPTQYLIGHSVDFDWAVVGKPEIPRICTLALSRYLWPLIGSHSLGALMFHLFPRQDARQFIKSAHSAAADVIMTWALLFQMIQIINQKPDVDVVAVTDWSELHLLSEVARVPTVMGFGKHKGKAFKDIPRDYKRWLLGQPDVDPYLAKALSL